jgi:cell division protein FtsB
VSRWVALTLLIILAALQVKLWVSGGMREVWRLEAVVQTQKTANALQQARNEQLEAEVIDLKEGAEAVEERARSELGMVKNDEVFYQVIESSAIGGTGIVEALNADAPRERGPQTVPMQNNTIAARQFALRAQ